MKTNTSIIISVLVAVLAIGGAIYFSGRNLNQSAGDEQNINNVSIVNGQQIIEIKAKGGYNPAHSVAKAGIPTILRLDTNGTLDCTSVVRIPSLDISKNLPLTGTTDINLGTPKVATISGTCGMGMYPFDIKFE